MLLHWSATLCASLLAMLREADCLNVGPYQTSPVPDKVATLHGHATLQEGITPMPPIDRRMEKEEEEINGTEKKKRKKFKFVLPATSLSDCADDFFLGMMGLKAKEKTARRFECLNIVLRKQNMEPYPENYQFHLDPDDYLLDWDVRPYWPRQSYECFEWSRKKNMPFLYPVKEEKRWEGRDATDKCLAMYILTKHRPPKLWHIKFKHSARPSDKSPGILLGLAVIVPAVLIFWLLWCHICKSARDAPSRRELVEQATSAHQGGPGRSSDLESGEAPRPDTSAQAPHQSNNFPDTLPSYETVCPDAKYPQRQGSDPPPYEEVLKLKGQESQQGNV